MLDALKQPTAVGDTLWHAGTRYTKAGLYTVTALRGKRVEVLVLGLAQNKKVLFAPHKVINVTGIISDTPIADARARLIDALMVDKEFAWAYHCQIAVSAMDEGVDHETANHIAVRAMTLLFDIDTHEMSERNINGLHPLPEGYSTDDQ